MTKSNTVMSLAATPEVEEKQIGKSQTERKKKPSPERFAAIRRKKRPTPSWSTLHITLSPNVPSAEANLKVPTALKIDPPRSRKPNPATTNLFVPRQ